jgi:hypothetical protein
MFGYEEGRHTKPKKPYKPEPGMPHMPYIPMDVITNFEQYTNINYENLRNYVDNNYSVINGYENTFNIFNVYSDEKVAEAQAQSFGNATKLDIFVCPTNAWNGVGPYEKTKAVYQFYEDDAVLKKFLEGKMQQSEFAKNMAKQTVLKAKAKNIEETGKDTKSLKEYNEYQSPNMPRALTQEEIKELENKSSLPATSSIEPITTAISSGSTTAVSSIISQSPNNTAQTSSAIVQTSNNTTQTSNNTTQTTVKNESSGDNATSASRSDNATSISAIEAHRKARLEMSSNDFDANDVQFNPNNNPLQKAENMKLADQSTAIADVIEGMPIRTLISNPSEGKLEESCLFIK